LNFFCGREKGRSPRCILFRSTIFIADHIADEMKTKTIEMTLVLYILIAFVGVLTIASFARNGTLDLDSISTDLISEGLTNVYFSVERARGAISAQGSGITYNQDTGVITVNSTGTISDLDTDSITEGATNKYFTEERARSALSTTGDLQYDSTIGVFSFTDAVTSVNNQTGNVELDTDNVTEGATNKYFTDERARSSLSTTGDLQYDSTTGVFGFTDAVTAVNNQTGNVELDTDNITEGVNNKYFTEERARSALSTTGDIQYDSTTGVFSFTDAVTSVNNQTGNVELDTDNITEGSTNKYFTEERARSALSTTGDLQYDSTTGVFNFTDAVTSVNNQTGNVELDTDNITEGSTNKYFTEERARSSLSANGNAIQFDASTGELSVNILTPKLPLLSLRTSDYQSNSLDSDIIEFTASEIISDSIDGWNVVGRVYNVLIPGTYEMNLALDPREFSTNFQVVVFRNGQTTGLKTSVNMEGGSIYGSMSSQMILPLEESDQISIRIVVDRSSFPVVVFIPHLTFSLRQIPSSLVQPVTGFGASPVISVNGSDGIVSLNTSQIPEGTNSYFTVQRARDSLVPGHGIQIDYSTGTISSRTALTKIHYVGPDLLYTPITPFIGPALEDISEIFTESFHLGVDSFWNDSTHKMIIPKTGYYRVSGYLDTDTECLFFTDIDQFEQSNVPLPSRGSFNDVVHLSEGMTMGIYYYREFSGSDIRLHSKSTHFTLFNNIRPTNFLIIEPLG